MRKAEFKTESFLCKNDGTVIPFEFLSENEKTEFIKSVTEIAEEELGRFLSANPELAEEIKKLKDEWSGHKEVNPEKI